MTPALDVSPETLCDIAQTIARTAGERIFELRRQGVSVAATKLSDIDVVTAADQESERLVVEMLAELRPDDGVLGEEGASEGTSGITWVIDPIDGTVNYLYDLPTYTVSIGATVADESATYDGRRGIAGAVYNPSTDEMFDAWEGGGSRRNGEPIGISGNDELATALVATGFGYTVERKQEQLKALTRLLPRIRDIRRLGGAAYDFGLLASGHTDAFYEIGLQPWDYAAGALIAREAGAVVLGLDDRTAPGEPMLIAAAPRLAHAIRDLVVT